MVPKSSQNRPKIDQKSIQKVIKKMMLKVTLHNTTLDAILVPTWPQNGPKKVPGQSDPEGGPNASKRTILGSWGHPGPKMAKPCRVRLTRPIFTPFWGGQTLPGQTDRAHFHSILGCRVRLTRPIFTPFWGRLRLSRHLFTSFWVYVGVILGPCWNHFGAML